MQRGEPNESIRVNHDDVGFSKMSWQKWVRQMWNKLTKLYRDLYVLQRDKDVNHSDYVSVCFSA